MAKRGFAHSFLSATVAALVVFFFLYFFVPDMSMQFLGVSNASRRTTSLVNAAVDSTVTAFENADVSEESLQKLRQLFASDEVQAKLKAAAQQGAEALKDAAQTVADSVKQ